MDGKIMKGNIKMERRVHDVMLKMLEEWRELRHCSSECHITRLLEMHHLTETLFIVGKYSKFSSVFYPSPPPLSYVHGST